MGGQVTPSELGLEFRLLGPFELASRGRVAEIGSPKQRLLLAMLVVRLNRVVSVDALAEELWQGRPPSSLAKTIQSLVYRLRRALTAAGAEAAGVALRARGTGYALEADRLQVDAQRFEHLAARGRELAGAGASDAAARTLRDALALWRGPALVDLLDADFARAEAARLDEARLVVTEELAEAEMARDHPVEAVALLEPHVAAHALRERAWGQLMVALYRTGRQAEALRAYQQLRTLLGQELGLEPTPALRALEAQILTQSPELVAPRPSDWMLTATGVDAAPAPARTPFVGRQSETAELSDLLIRALGGSGGLVMVSGEPGVGKTRLVEEISARALRRRALVFVGRCYEAEGSAPFTPFAELLEGALARNPEVFRAAMGEDAPELARLLPRLRRLFPDIGQPLELDPEQERRQLFAAVTDTLARTARAVPTVLVLEDLHWADESTLLLLDHLAGDLVGLPALVVGTYRDDELNPYLARTLDTLIRRRLVHQIRLDRLFEPDVAGMLGALAGGQEAPRAVVDVLYSETQGNPFFVEEVFRHLVEEGRLFDDQGRFQTGVVLGELDVPDNVRLVIGRRFDRLSESARRVLSIAAVAGRYFDYGLLERCAGDDVVLDALDEAEGARLVAPLPGHPTGDRFGFVHELVRQTLLTQLSTARRCRLHLAVADAMEETLGGQERASDLAHHLVASAPLGGGARTAMACLAAGDRALSALAGAEAIGWYEQGLQFATGDVGLQTDLFTGLGEAQRRTGHREWRQTLLDASRLATEQRDAARLVRAVLANNRGVSSVIGHADEERLEFLASALDLVGPAPTTDRAELLALQAVELVFAGDHERVLQAADEAAFIAAGLEDVAVRARVGVRRLWACMVPGRFHAVASEGGEVVGLADATGDLQLRVWSRVLWAFALLSIGDLDEARRQTAEAMSIADESGQPGLRSATRSAHGAALDALGEHDEDARLTQVALELGQEASWPDAMAWYGARMWMHWSFGGQNEIAAEVMAQAFAEYPQMIAWQGGWALELGLIGRSKELAGVLATLHAVLPRVPVDIFWVDTHFYFAMAQGYGVEDRTVAGAIYRALFPYRSLHVAFGIGYWGPVEVGLAVAARVMGDADVALVHHEAAMIAIEACGAARAKALNSYQWAVTLLARDGPHDRQRAIEMLEDTLAYCQSRGYLTFERKAQQLLSTLTATSPA